jgi:hypothetical protein
VRAVSGRCSARPAAASGDRPRWHRDRTVVNWPSLNCSRAASALRARRRCFGPPVMGLRLCPCVWGKRKLPSRARAVLMGTLISVLVASLASVSALATQVGRSTNGSTAVAASSCPAHTTIDCRRIGGGPPTPTEHRSARRGASKSGPSAIARARACGRFRAGGTRFSVMAVRGPVRCGRARRVLRDFLSGRGRMHGPRSGPVSEESWTVDGWRCGYGTGGGACIHRGGTYKTARAWIVAQQTS